MSHSGDDVDGDDDDDDRDGNDGGGDSDGGGDCGNGGDLTTFCSSPESLSEANRLSCLAEEI